MRRRTGNGQVHKNIAPRLKSGEKRVGAHAGLPPAIKDGLRMRAVAEGRSLSWMLEEALIDHFGLRRPAYIVKKEE